MFQFRRFPTYDYVFTIRWLSFSQPGCPIRKSMDIASAYDSPWLIAVNRVLLRLPVPRHSPCALSSLTLYSLPSLENLCLSYFHSMKYCNITLFLCITDFSFKDGLCNTCLLFSSCFLFFIQFSRYDSFWVFLKLKVQYLTSVKYWSLGFNLKLILLK